MTCSSVPEFGQVSRRKGGPELLKPGVRQVVGPVFGGGGGGCCSKRSSSGSRHAQVGALLDQMFIVGRTAEGSSNAPTRTAVTCGLADEFANSGDPHLGQKRCCILLPLSAVLANSLNCPETSIAAVATSKFTMPLADRCWQSRHQQTLVASGSAERRKRTAPQRQCPVLSVMGSFSVELHNSLVRAHWSAPKRRMWPRWNNAATIRRIKFDGFTARLAWPQPLPSSAQRRPKPHASGSIAAGDSKQKVVSPGAWPRSRHCPRR